STWRPCARATTSSEATRASSSERSRAAPSARVRSPPRRSRTCARGWASARPGRLGAVSLASLEIDLDVFSGPFDLLLTLVLKEEVDLLELALADVVLA